MQRDYLTALYGVILIALSVFLLVAGRTVIGQSARSGLAYDPSFVPNIVIGLMIALSSILIFQSLRKPTVKDDSNPFDWRKVAIVVGLIGLYFMSIRYLGFLIPSALFLFSFIFVFGYRNKGVTILVSLVIPAVIYFTFVTLLKIPLPELIP
ncbi:MAG: tripartite tricarboxylate transporter TctB family protein [Natronospirillum sp.]